MLFFSFLKLSLKKKEPLTELYWLSSIFLRLEYRLSSPEVALLASNNILTHTMYTMQYNKHCHSFNAIIKVAKL